MTDFSDYLDKAVKGAAFSEGEMIGAMTFIMEGAVGDESLARFLTALSDRGETEDEITGAAKVLRGMAHTISCPPETVDCCGTGGDGLHTFNISTAVAFVAAGAGVPVAKHGNRAASSKSGAADVLEALGVNISLPQKTLETALHTLGFCFLMAPNHHPAMKIVMPVRRSLGRRTIFNLLGPLINPAGAPRQMVGVSDKKFMVPIVKSLRRLGSKAAWAVHSSEGMDEISLSGETLIASFRQNKDGPHADPFSYQSVSAKDFGLPSSMMNDIRGGDAAQNASALLGLLQGHRTAYRNVVVANSAALFVMAEKAQTFKEGVFLAEQSIDSGRALNILKAYKDIRA